MIMNFKELLHQLTTYLRSILDTSDERENEVEIIENIRKGIDFKGSNLWILIFAIFIASLGLNVNSTAVIIGAMLISPLMGPIMGIGLGLGINDFELIKKAFRNLAIATVFGILTSTFYFLLSPLNEARSELLARTTPTIYDVLIAFFGGMAGIVASGSRLKGNVIPGVAIATALMPPLCTAGFGIASGNLTYFFGAFYLYMINSVFIAFATTLGVKLMHLSKKTFVDKVREKKVQQIVYTILFLTMVPSIYITYEMVKANIFETNATRFINNEINFPNTLIVNKHIQSENADRAITISLIGKEISEESISMLHEKMERYGLLDTKLFISQGFGREKEEVEQDELNNLVLQDFYKLTKSRTESQEKEIVRLKQQLENYGAYDSVSMEIGPEVKVLFPHIQDIAISRILVTHIDSLSVDTRTIAITSYKRLPQPGEEKKFESWLSTRLKVEKLEIIRKTQ